MVGGRIDLHNITYKETVKSSALRYPREKRCGLVLAGDYMNNKLPYYTF